jgi:CRP-like cAMP-binding protein
VTESVRESAASLVEAEPLPENEGSGSVARAVHEIFLTSFLGEDELLDLELLGPAFGRLAEMMTDEEYAPGEQLYKSGDPARDYLFIGHGEVVLKMADGSVLTLGDRNVVGGGDVTANRPHGQTATATTKVHVVRLPQDVMWEVIEDYFLIAQMMIRNASKAIQVLRMQLAMQDSYPPLRAHDVASSADVALNLVDRILAIRASAPFRNAPMQAVTKLAEVARDVGFPAGDPVTGPDSPPDLVYLVMVGALEIRHKTEPRLAARFAANEVVFLDASILGALADYDIVAPTTSIALVWDLDDVLDIMEEHVDVVRTTLVSMTDEFERLLKQALDSSTEPLEGEIFKRYRRS